MAASVLDSPLLNDAQRQAVAILDGPLLVIAGAGSGKTLTLTHRAAHLVEQGVPPEGILLLTFTRKAAQEMLSRAASLPGSDGRCERISGGTFHAFCHGALRRHGGAIGCPSGFTILDRSDAEELLGILRAEMGFTERERRFPRRETVADWGSKTVNCAMSLADVVAREAPQFADDVADVERLLAAYARYKAEHALLDYDDLLVWTCRLLEEAPAVRDGLSRAHPRIQVDEYQDTNFLQARILRLLASTHENVMVVGDDCQSIYAFRGARVANILDFPKEYKGTRIVRLERNYRSVQPILDLANSVVASMNRKHPKRLSAMRDGDERPVLLRCAGDREVALAIVRRLIEEREKGRPLSDMAVLFRSAYHSFELELALTQAGIPFVKWGGVRFLETAHLKDLLAFLRVVANPRDRLSWTRLLRLADGIGEKTASRIAAACAAGEPLARLKAPPKAARHLAAFAHALSEVERSRDAPPRAVEAALEVYAPILREKYPDDAPARARDLEQFSGIVRRYRRIETLLSDLALDPVPESVASTAGGTSDERPLVLSTIHSAKGLEWGVVFVLALVEGRFPPAYTGEDPEALDEERRLFYVAVTRAKDRLVLTHPAYHFERAFGTVLSRPSRFVEELPGVSYRLEEVEGTARRDWAE